MKFLWEVAVAVALVAISFGTAAAWDEPCERELRAKISGKLAGRQLVRMPDGRPAFLQLSLSQTTLKVEGDWPDKNAPPVHLVDLDLLMIQRSIRPEQDNTATMRLDGCLHKGSQVLTWRFTLVVIRVPDSASYDIWMETLTRAKRPLPVIVP